MKLSPLYLVRQNFPDRSVSDIPATVRKELTTTQFASKLKPGARVAIGVGSRGITNIATIVRAVVDYWKSQGMRPFIFPAMGSHGAATAEGQADVLAHYGIIEETMGCPVISSLEVVPVGTTRRHQDIHGSHAYESDGVAGRAREVAYGFRRKIESGLFVMMAIGSRSPARSTITPTPTRGLEAVIQSIGRQVLASQDSGLAILEDAHHNTGQLTAGPAEVMEKRERDVCPGEILTGWIPWISIS
jgi:hypothetical protein